MTLFTDLPSVAFANPKGISEAMLKTFGVREHVELQVIFNRLDTELGWDHQQLVKYLASIQSKLSNLEFERLQVTPLFPSESMVEKKEGGRVKRYRAVDLYAPSDNLRQLAVDIIKWDKWRVHSDEGTLFCLAHMSVSKIRYKTLVALL